MSKAKEIIQQRIDQREAELKRENGDAIFYHEQRIIINELQHILNQLNQ